MEYRRLGFSGILVSPICLGTMLFGGRTDDATADRMVGLARECGVNFIDTAESYIGGKSEEIVGRLIAPDRDHWILATKVGQPAGDGPNDRGLGRRRIMAAVDGSLRRLATDFIDIYYLHREDGETRLEETLTAAADLIRCGKIRHFALSNYRGWRVAEVVRLCDILGIDRPIGAQPYYNLMNRTPEVDYIPACAYYGLGVVPYSPLARGVLTGKYTPGGAPPPASRAAVHDRRIMETEFREESLITAEKIKERAAARGMTGGQFALLWLLGSRFVTSAVVGPRTIEQFEENLDALRHGLEPQDEVFVDGLVPPGHPSTPGYTDPAYPVTGRAPRRRPDAA